MKRQAALSLPRQPKDPFYGFFQEETATHVPTKDLLQFNNARRWLKSIGWHSRNDYYLYQQALESKSGPEVVLNDQRFIMLSSYDYLGLIGHPAIENAAIEAVQRFGTGTGGVRLLTGTNELHRELEANIADFKGTEAAITFTSGYMANIAAITGLMNSQGLIFLDEYIHRSIIDACELAKTPYKKYRHNDTEDLERLLREAPPNRRKLIITEGIFSMDGDRCPLPEIVRLKNLYEAFLLVDEAHAFGYVGPSGRGTDEYFGIDPEEVDIWTGSLSKTIPSNGGFIAGKQQVIYYLQHGAAPFFFSSALCPAAAASINEALNVIRRESERIQHLEQNTNYLLRGLQKLGYNTGQTDSPIIPVIIGEDMNTHRLTRELFAHGIIATAVVFPAVPLRESRLRVCVTAGHRKALMDEILTVFAKLAPDYV